METWWKSLAFSSGVVKCNIIFNQTPFWCQSQKETPWAHPRRDFCAPEKLSQLGHAGFLCVLLHHISNPAELVPQHQTVFPGMLKFGYFEGTWGLLLHLQWICTWVPWESCAVLSTQLSSKNEGWRKGHCVWPCCSESSELQPCHLSSHSKCCGVQEFMQEVKLPDLQWDFSTNFCRIPSVSLHIYVF